MRALRAIPTRLPSRVDLELDELATVDASTQGLGIVPILRPRLERWFDAALVVDHSPSSEIWTQTVVEIERVLACSGVFRDVRTFRLQRTPTLRLLNESDSVLRPGVLRDPTARRIIFVFSPGVTEAWTDGTFGQLVESWGASTPVALLHALPRRLWSHTVLGEPGALVTNPSPGGPNTGLIPRRAWWARARRIDGRRATMPVLALDPESASRWAEMLASRRGRSSPAFLIPVGPATTKSSATQGHRRVAPVAERVSLLRANAPDAFRLAVRLAMGPFTMPILQLVQSSLFGRDAEHSQVAEVMLSGLVTRVTLGDARIPPEQVLFQFSTEASTLLLESLRRDDARKMSMLLQGYIEQHFGTPKDQLVLLEDPHGPLVVPAAAQPFARLNDQFVRWLGRSVPQTDSGATPAIQKAESAPAAFTPTPAARETSAATSDEPLRVATLHRTFGELPRTDVPWLHGLRILWVDDRPGNNSSEMDEFAHMGAAAVATATTTKHALEWLQSEPCDIVISDMARPDGREAGLELLSALRRRSDLRPLIIYAASWAGSNQDRAREAGAFGCTNQRRELITLVVEAGLLARRQRFYQAYTPPSGLERPVRSILQELPQQLPARAAQQLADMAGEPPAKAAACVAMIATLTRSCTSNCSERRGRL